MSEWIAEHDLSGPYITKPCHLCGCTGVIAEGGRNRLCERCNGFGNTVRPMMLVDSEWIAEVD